MPAAEDGKERREGVLPSSSPRLSKFQRMINIMTQLVGIKTEPISPSQTSKDSNKKFFQPIFVIEIFHHSFVSSTCMISIRYAMSKTRAYSNIVNSVETRGNFSKTSVEKDAQAKRSMINKMISGKTKTLPTKPMRISHRNRIPSDPHWQALKTAHRFPSLSLQKILTKIS